MDSELTDEPENIVSAAELLKVYATAVDEALARIAELEAENERILDLLAKFVGDLRAARAAYLGETNGT